MAGGRAQGCKSAAPVPLAARAGGRAGCCCRCRLRPARPRSRASRGSCTVEAASCAWCCPQPNVGMRVTLLLKPGPVAAGRGPAFILYCKTARTQDINQNTCQIYKELFCMNYRCWHRLRVYFTTQ